MIYRIDYVNGSREVNAGHKIKHTLRELILLGEHIVDIQVCQKDGASKSVFNVYENYAKGLEKSYHSRCGV